MMYREDKNPKLKPLIRFSAVRREIRDAVTLLVSSAPEQVALVDLEQVAVNMVKEQFDQMSADRELYTELEQRGYDETE